MSNLNLNEMKKNALLQMAGKQLGKDPAELKQKLESGQVQDVVNSLSDEQKQKLQSVLQNPQQLSALLGSEQVQNLLKAMGNR
ncbi:MAG: hypothetical protein FWE19_01330 [Oscillospiraceae bacterium]|nr:hypothetical protein [Oscillospiraceae bacterium]